jgi:ABC-type branched-subunit amino acid transport system ATPase component
MLLSVESVAKRFDTWLALDDVSLEVQEGHIVGIVGPNGSGKSTLLGVVSRHVEPDKGRVLLRGEDIRDIPRWSLPGRGVVRLFQSPKLCSSISLLDNLIVARVDGTGIAVSDAAAALRLVGVADGLFKVSPKSLTHLDRRRVELGRAFLGSPRLVLMDEPTSGLSNEEAASVEPLVRLLRERGASVLLVEHNLRLVRDLCDQVLVLEAGRVVAQGSPASPAVAREIGLMFGTHQHASG